jgi:hypothetical protein
MGGENVIQLIEIIKLEGFIRLCGWHCFGVDPDRIGDPDSEPFQWGLDHTQREFDILCRSSQWL